MCADAFPSRRSYVACTLMFTLHPDIFVRLPRIWADCGRENSSTGGVLWYFLAYVLLLVLVVGPMIFLESSFGQVVGGSLIRAWRYLPFYRGLSLCMLLVNAGCLLYACTYTADVFLHIYYTIITSDRDPLPWFQCPKNPTDASVVCVANLAKNYTLVDGKVHVLSSEIYYNNVVELPSYAFATTVFNQQQMIACVLVWLFVFMVLASGIQYIGRFAEVALFATLASGICFLIAVQSHVTDVFSHVLQLISNAISLPTDFEGSLLRFSWFAIVAMGHLGTGVHYTFGCYRKSHWNVLLNMPTIIFGHLFFLTLLTLPMIPLWMTSLPKMPGSELTFHSYAVHLGIVPQLLGNLSPHRKLATLGYYVLLAILSFYQVLARTESMTKCLDDGLRSVCFKKPHIGRLAAAFFVCIWICGPALATVAFNKVSCLMPRIYLSSSWMLTSWLQCVALAVLLVWVIGWRRFITDDMRNVHLASLRKCVMVIFVGLVGVLGPFVLLVAYALCCYAIYANGPVEPSRIGFNEWKELKPLLLAVPLIPLVLLLFPVVCVRLTKDRMVRNLTLRQGLYALAEEADGEEVDT